MDTWSNYNEKKKFHNCLKKMYLEKKQTTCPGSQQGRERGRGSQMAVVIDVYATEHQLQGRCDCLSCEVRRADE